MSSRSIKIALCWENLFVLVRTCFVAPKFSGPKDEPRPASMVHQVDYPLDGGRILRIEGQIRWEYNVYISPAPLISFLANTVLTTLWYRKNIIFIHALVLHTLFYTKFYFPFSESRHLISFLMVMKRRSQLLQYCWTHWYWYWFI